MAFEITLDTKLREFQYKLPNLIIFTSKKYRFKTVESPLCAFCKEEEESLEHLLFLCKSSSFFFWKEVLSWLADDVKISLNLSLLDILFGKFDLNDFLLVNHVILLAKIFIYKCKYSNVNPSLIVFKAKLKATYQSELFIAKRNGRLLIHYKKWNPLVSFFTCRLTLLFGFIHPISYFIVY